jgi:rare lipoprotein A
LITPRSVRLALALAFGATLAAPAAASAQLPAGTPAPTGGTPAAADGQIALVARPDALLRRVTRFRGAVGAADAGRTVAIERLDPLVGSWTTLTTAVVGRRGEFLARWRADRLGSFRVRALLRRAGEASAASASPEVAVTVYRPATATWYGPGFYGRRTACGVKLTRSLLGVAHKKHPCGTPIAISYRGRTITVPVVDRGPFARGVSWDLTAAAADLLGLEVTARIGALRVG